MFRSLAVLLLIAVVLLIPFLIWGEAIDAWIATAIAHAPSPLLAGVLIFALLAADIFLPVPSSLVATAAGAVLGFAVGSVVIAAGLSLGGLVGFVLARRLGAPFCRRMVGEADFATMAAAFDRWGPGLVAALRPVPLLAEASLLTAGAVGVRAVPALIAMLLANIGLGLFYAGLGAWAVKGGSFLTAIVASCLLPGLGWALTRLRRPGAATTKAA